MLVEKRKYNRFLARPDTYAALGPLFTKVGKVRQISIGGLAFEYICTTEHPDRHSTEIAVFLCKNEFFLSNLPCRVISDLPNCAFDKDPIADSIYAVNQCAVQLTAITENQRRRLEYLLEHHTRGLAPIAMEMNLAH